MSTEPDLMKKGLLKAAVGVGVAAVFLIALHLVGSDTCLDSGGRVEKLFYCSLGSKELISFPNLVQIRTLIVLAVGPVVLGGAVGTWLLLKYVRASRQ